MGKKLSQVAILNTELSDQNDSLRADVERLQD